MITVSTNSSADFPGSSEAEMAFQMCLKLRQGVGTLYQHIDQIDVGSGLTQGSDAILRKQFPLAKGNLVNHRWAMLPATKGMNFSVRRRKGGVQHSLQHDPHLESLSTTCFMKYAHLPRNSLHRILVVFFPRNTYKRNVSGKNYVVLESQLILIIFLYPF